MAENILTIKNLGINFGGIVALDKVSFDVQEASITSLIGPNGAGKTTLFNCLTGFYKATTGELIFASKNGEMNIKKVLGEKFTKQDIYNPFRMLEKLRYKMFGGVHVVVRGGLARTFQNIRLFRGMTVLENLLVAQHHSLNLNLISGVIQTANYKKKERAAVDKAYQILDMLHLTNDANAISSSLPYGKEKKVEIARSLCGDKLKVICLDEPAAGLNSVETEELSKTIQDIRDKLKITIFLIEHDMSLVMDISDYVIVLDHGKVIAKGKPKVIRNDPKVIEAYLGSEAVQEKPKKTKK